MIEIVWEYVVKEEARGQFELAFGPGGIWSKLFALGQGFRGTTLIRDIKNPQRYLLFDLWDSADQRDQILAEHEDEYASLENAFASWTESKEQLGTYRVLAEATVHPRGKTRRGKARDSRRRSR